MKSHLRPTLTQAMLRSRRSRAGATQSEASKGRTSLKYVPRPVIEVVLSDLLDAVQLAWERLNDATVSEPVSGATPKSGGTWSDGTPIPTPDEE